MVCQGFPELAVDERNDTTGVFWCAAVILANIDISMDRLGKFVVSKDKPDLAWSPPLLSAFCPICACVPCRAAAYLPEATDVILNIAWDPEIWL